MTLIWDFNNITWQCSQDLGMPPPCFAKHLLPQGFHEGIACKESKQKGHNVLMSCRRARSPSAEVGKVGIENVSQVTFPWSLNQDLYLPPVVCRKQTQCVNVMLRSTEELSVPGSSHCYQNRMSDPACSTGTELEHPISLVAAAGWPLWNSNRLAPPLYVVCGGLRESRKWGRG